MTVIVEVQNFWTRNFSTIKLVAGAAILVYLLRKFFEGGQYRKKNRIDGKVVIITGCNTGIGKETALELARRGGKIYMACRDKNRCEAARLEIIEKTGNKNIFNRSLDLASFESIRNFVAKFKEEETRLDILINNAGLITDRRSLTKDGFETIFGVNHLGPFLLTNLLLDRLKESAPSRIVNVSSFGHMFGKINQDDLLAEKSFNNHRSYTQSKLANILFSRQLSMKLAGTGVVANSLHPGAVRTEFMRELLVSEFWKLLFAPFFLFFCKSAKSGAQTTIKVAIDPDLETVTAQYYSDCIRMPLLKRARDDKMAEWLWNKSAEFTGLVDKPENSEILLNKKPKDQ